MKSLEQELVESKAKIENLTCTKFALDNRSVSVSLKPKTEKVYIPLFKRNKSVFVPTCHIYGVVGHIRPNCSLLRQKPKSDTRFAVRNTDVSKSVLVCHFCGVSDHIRPNCHKLKSKHSVF